MAVRSQQVETAIEIVVEEEDTELQKQPACGPYPFGNRFVREEQGTGLRNIKRAHLVRKIANGYAHCLVIPVMGSINSHGAPCVAVAIETYPRLRADFLECTVVLVV